MINSDFADRGVEALGALVWARAEYRIVVVPDLLSRLQRQDVIVRNQDRLAR